MTLKKRLSDFFEANPDEELTLLDIRVKFGASVSHTNKVVRQMTACGRIDRTVVFRKGGTK